MYKKNQGHGICGAINVYSTNVKVGNWVEDTVGAELANENRNVYKCYDTNTSLSYIDPKHQPDPPNMPVNMPTTQELKSKNKEGMPYSLIFDHGLKPVTSQERMQTTNMNYIMKKTYKAEDQANEHRLTRSKSKQTLEDLRQSYQMTSQTRLANANLSFKLDIAPRPVVGKMDPLPNFSRTRKLTSTIPGMK